MKLLAALTLLTVSVFGLRMAEQEANHEEFGVEMHLPGLTAKRHEPGLTAKRHQPGLTAKRHQPGLTAKR